MRILRAFALAFALILPVIGIATPVTAQELGESFPQAAQPADPAVPPADMVGADSGQFNDQASPLLTVDQEQMFNASAWGRRAAEELEKEGAKINADNDRISAQLADEEEALTLQRETLDPTEFRVRAEEFDERATTIRRERNEVVQELNARVTADRNAFIQAAIPIMAEIMERRKAVAIMDRRSVLLPLEAIDITDQLVAELDAKVGAGPGFPAIEDLPQARPERSDDAPENDGQPDQSGD